MKSNATTLLFLVIGLIAGLLLSPILFYQPKVMTKEQIADNVEYIAFYNQLQGVMRNDNMSLGKMKEYYSEYSGMQSRQLLEHYAYVICYTNATSKDFKRRSESLKIDYEKLWG